MSAPLGPTRPARTREQHHGEHTGHRPRQPGARPDVAEIARVQRSGGRPDLVVSEVVFVDSEPFLSLDLDGTRATRDSITLTHRQCRALLCHLSRWVGDRPGYSPRPAGTPPESSDQ